jgi:hypothetical protein
LTTNGLIKRRTHIDCDNPRGQLWESVASDIGFKELSVGDSSVYALDEAGKVYRRMEVSADNGVGCDWERISGIDQGFIFISGAEINLVYAIATDGTMWYLYPGGIWVPPTNADFDWTYVEGGPMLTLDVGRNGRVVGSNAQGVTFFREGISKNAVTGTHWEELQSEAMKQVSMCSSGTFLGLGAADGLIFARNEVNDDTPKGQSWAQLEVFQQGGFTQISCGYRDMIVGVSQGRAYFRTGYDAENSLGSGWMEFPAEGLASDDLTFTHISIGDDGKIWAVVDGDVYSRNGVQADSWTQIEGGRMRQVEVGRSSVWGINKWNEIWYREQCPDNAQDCDLTMTDWTNEPGTLIWIACTQKTVVWGLDEDNEIWFHTPGTIEIGDELTDAVWDAVPGKKNDQTRCWPRRKRCRT